ACEDDDAAVAAFGGCAGAVAALGCDFVFGGVPISESCPVSCDACPDEPIFGCTDMEACNYDPDATADNNSCEEFDCAGECGGGAENDECGICNGDNSSCSDCAGTPNGDAVEDECGVCEGDNSTCLDCEGVLNGDAVEDDCGVCEGDGTSCVINIDFSLGDAINGGIDVFMANTHPVLGFQFDVSGMSFSAGEGSGGSAEANGFTVSTGPNGVLGVSVAGTAIPVGDGLLTSLVGEFDDFEACITDVVLSVDGEGFHTYTSGDCVATDAVADCAGVANGDSWLSDCGCVAADNSGDDCDDCAGVPNGSAYEDNCGVCDDDPTNDCDTDCAGEPGGDAVEDMCGVCDNDSSNDCVQDCNGEWGGIAELDECDVCGGDGSDDLGCGCFEPGPSGCDNACGSDLVDDECGECGGDGPEENFDCDGDCLIEVDCAGECGGSAYEVTLCEDTDGDGLGNPGSETTECVEGGRDVADGCDLPVDNILLNSDGSVVYNASSNIAGFQFNVDGATINTATGGDAGAAGMMMSASGSMVLGFSLTGGTFGPCGTMVNLDLSGEATGLSGFVISNATGAAINFTYYIETNDTELVADCSDMYPDCASNMVDCAGECDGMAEEDCAGECGGTAVEDECGVCDGDGSEENFDCDGNCTVDIDCLGECGGSAEDLGCGCSESAPSDLCGDGTLVCDESECVDDSGNEFYVVDLESTGNSQLTIFSDSITGLEVGDEIGIFDTDAITNYNDCSNQIGE
ncbi:MAG: hypothetical protein HOA66_04915, partial [Candidatus Marinimicrobia bacterium]|nr:hypothetical protein [Candidatus Neomarinimicrobiota bacterium]